MSILKPPRLNKGDVIAIAAPGSPPKSSETLNKGIRYLERLGYRVLLGKYVERRYGYLAGSDAERAGDLNSFFADPRVKAIFTVRGGYGSHRILSLVNYRMIQRNPKILVGYSDITALQCALLAKTRLVTFSGPMVATDLGEEFHGAAEEWFWRCLTSTKPLGVVKNPNRKTMKTLRRGSAVGRLIGGNLSLVTALLGTPFFPDVRRFILFLEDVDEEPYRLDRMLNHLTLALPSRRLTGLLFGEFKGCTPETPRYSLRLPQVLRDFTAGQRVPAIEGLRYGHVRNPLTLPLGVTARVRASVPTVELLEAAVR
jgi:muramoyltetrapeptide carboxypeptidase